MTDSASKKRRLSWASPGKSSPGAALQIVPTGHHEQQDIIEFFAQRGEQKKELESEVQSLEIALQDLQARLTQSETAVSHLKEDLGVERSEKAALERILQKEKDLMDSAIQREMGKAAGLQVDLLAAQKQRSDAEAAREQTEARVSEAERAARRQHADLESRAARLEAQLHQQGLDMDSCRRRSEAEASMLQKALDMTERAQRELEEQLEEAVKLAEDAAQRRRHAEAQVVSLQADLESVSAARGSKGISEEECDTAFQLRMLQDLVQRQEDEVKEARALNSHASKAAILEEQLQAAEGRCRRLEATAAQYAQLQAQQQPQQRELEQWRSLLGDLPEAERGPPALMRMLDDLRGQTLTLADQTGQHKAQALRLQGELQAAQAAARQAAAALSQVEAAEAEASGMIARLERKVALLTKERNVLKEIVASYDAEEANLSADAVQTPQKKRLDSLEATNRRLTEQVAHLEAEAAASAVALRKQAEQTSSAAERAAAADAEVARLQAEVESHEKQIALLEARAGRGEYNPANTRVLHFVHNPEAEARREHEAARISELEAESATLRVQLQALQPKEAGGGLESMAAAVAAAEKTVLEQKVRDLEKQQSRLKEVFKTQVSSFREACYCLFGYRIDMASQAMPTGAKKGMPPTTFVLKPQHADVPSAQLLFKMESEGQMALLPNDYVLKHLNTEAETFITRFKSIPAFTANLTMENFQKQTRC